MEMLQILLVLCALCAIINGDVLNDCGKHKDCSSCVKSHRPLPGFQRFCGWHTSKSICGEPFAIEAGGSIVVREPFSCPRRVPEAKGRRYTDRLGRSLFSLTLAVRNSDPTECLANSRPDIQLIKRYEVECDQSHNLCASMLAVSKPAKSIYVVYKSSNMDKQLITEFIHIVAAQLGVWEKFEAGGGVTTYFFGAFERLFKRSGMKDDLIKLRQKYPGYRVWCTGHSLGGSMSSMTALYLVKMNLFPPELVRLVTFGEPRTGNVAFARAVEENVQFRYRVVHRGDPVTNMPATVNLAGLLLSPTVAERQPYFYRYLVFYDNDMKPGSLFNTCTLSEDYACRNLALSSNALDHINYFDVNPDTYLSNQCKGDLLKLAANRTTTTTATTKTTTTMTIANTTDTATDANTTTDTAIDADITTIDNDDMTIDDDIAAAAAAAAVPDDDHAASIVDNSTAIYANNMTTDANDTTTDTNDTTADADADTTDTATDADIMTTVADTTTIEDEKIAVATIATNTTDTTDSSKQNQ
uniref:Lipase_3 domain-containing protein n=1 Tax=Onchocerca volvulus TaxID=6282 RepID=A0A8R1TPG2_ONCVO